jgi:predicted RNase H-like HicB family nuclease
MEIQFTTRIFKEGRTWVAHALELDVSSCGGTKEKAVKRLQEAVQLFLEGAERMGTLDQILKEAGYRRTKQRIASPKFGSGLDSLKVLCFIKSTIPRLTPLPIHGTLKAYAKTHCYKA